MKTEIIFFCLMFCLGVACQAGLALIMNSEKAGKRVEPATMAAAIIALAFGASLKLAALAAICALAGHLAAWVLIKKIRR